MPAIPIRVVVATDFSLESQHALACALSWAVCIGPDVHLLHVVESGRGVDETSRMMHELAELAQAAKRELEALEVPEARFLRPDLFPRHIVAGDPATEIIRAAARVGAQIVVVGARSQRHGSNPGSVAERVLQGAPCPVLSVDRCPVTSPATRSWRKVLCPIDFSDLSWRALASAIGLARGLKASVSVLHVRDSDAPSQDIDLDAAVAAFRSEAHWLSKEKVTTTCTVGSAAERILEIARLDSYDVIAIGTHGTGHHGDVAMGRVASAVVKRAPCPVLAVNPSAPGSFQRRWARGGWLSQRTRSAGPAASR